MDDLGEQALKLVRERRIPVGPRLTESEVVRFEQEHSIRLPDDYRWFMRNIGACCIGPPFGGLLPLDVPWNLWGEREQWSILPSPSKPFPFTHTCVWGAGNEPSLEFWVEKVWAGSLYLGTDGCRGYNLIVAGPERGHIWEFTQFGVYATEPRETFLSWFVEWAQKAGEQWLTARRRRPELPLLVELRRRG
jgi:hypothetical protein